MLRFVLLVACLASPAWSYSKGAPTDICKNNLVPEHHAEAQSGSPPYSFVGSTSTKSNEPITLTLSGDKFLGFAVQAREKDKPIGSFKIVESNNSQTLTCSNKDDTLTHKKIEPENPISRLEFQWIPPKDFKGKVQFVGTVAKNGGTYWVRKVLKEVTVA